MSKFTAATFPSQPTALGVTFAGKQVGHVCQALRNILFSAYFPLSRRRKTTFPCNKASNTSRDRAKAGSRPFLSKSLRGGLALVPRVWSPPPPASPPRCPRCCCCHQRGWRCGWQTPPCPGTRWFPCAGAAPASSWTWAGSSARSQLCPAPPDGWFSWWCLGWRCEPGPAGCGRPRGLQPNQTKPNPWAEMEKLPQKYSQEKFCLLRLNQAIWIPCWDRTNNPIQLLSTRIKPRCNFPNKI